MPRKDGSGPQGQGPKTGRGTGNCAGGQRGAGNKQRGGRGQ